MTGKSFWLSLVLFLAAGLLTGSAVADELDVGPVELTRHSGVEVQGVAIFPDEVLELERVEGPPVSVRFDRIHRLVFKEATRVVRDKESIRVAVYHLERVGGGSGIEGFIRGSRPVTFRLKNKDGERTYEIGPRHSVQQVVFSGNMARYEKGLDSPQGPKSPKLSRASKEYTVVIPGTTRWLRTGITLTEGQRIHITATGTIKWSQGRAGREVGPDGGTYSGWQDRPLPGNNLGLLIARVRPLPNKLYVVGSEKNIVAPVDGELELGINDEMLEDNTGNFRVHIVVEPN